ncbi:MAG: nuclear transport factor 2 family protein [Candidatus Melainabacteria bacterium]
MTSQIKAIRSYYEAFSRKDFDGMKPYMSDDFSFEDPFHTADSADQYIDMLRVMNALDYDIKLINTIESENEVVVRFDWIVQKPVITTIPMMEWFTFDTNGLISQSELLFDKGDAGKVMESIMPAMA